MPNGTILVVDDNEAMRLAVIDLLTDAGHAVHEAAGVRAGLRVGILFRLPGETRDIEIAGQVRWRDDANIGVEITDAGSEYAAVLEDLLNG